ncbi:prepilin peptidase [Candidatus Dojkabacteria bacterium]|nr:prepilin peptidase [Candidatus Dojkabacteria bacterium]
MVIAVFIIGIILASFLNALAYRLMEGARGYDLFMKPSHCEKCGRPLRVYDLIPILSYIITGGKCSQCGKKVFWYYPVSELFLGLAFMLLYWNNSSILPYLFLTYIFLLSYWDIKSKSIPKTLVDVIFGVSLIYALLSSFTYSLLAVAILFLAIWILNLKQEKIGLGDILIFSSTLLLFNLEIGILTLLITILISGTYAIYLVLKDRRNRKRYIPLVPFIMVAYVISIVTVNYVLDFISKYLYF